MNHHLNLILPADSTFKNNRSPAMILNLIYLSKVFSIFSLLIVHVTGSLFIIYITIRFPYIINKII